MMFHSLNVPVNTYPCTCIAKVLYVPLEALKYL